MNRYWKYGVALMLASVLLAAAGFGIRYRYFHGREQFVESWLLAYPAHAQAGGTASGADKSFAGRLVDAAIERTAHHVVYDPSYVVIPYPGGDVPDDRGVCSDVVVRSYRKVGIDLQKEVHEDMAANFSRYPKRWGLAAPDPNIDHRRVPNLMVFFKRKGETLGITQDPKAYAPGEIVCWDLGGGITHIGIVTDRRSKDRQRPMIVHNIGRGPELEDMIFDYKIIGHFRYYGEDYKSPGMSE